MVFKIKDGIQIDAGQSITEISIDGTLADNVDTAVPTEKAVKTYVDGKVGGTVTAKTTDYTILSADSGKIFTNYGSSATVNLTLPTAADGLKYSFINEVSNTYPDSSTKLLLHGNGNFTDYSAVPRTVTVNGAINSSTQVKFGSQSMYFDGSNDYLSLAHVGDMVLAAGDWTWDWWEYRTSVSVGCPFMSKLTAGGIGLSIGYYTSPNLVIYFSSNGSTWDILNGASMGAPTLNEWVHFAIVRSSGNIYVFKNGQLTFTHSVGTANIYDPGTTTDIGKHGSSYFAGYIDEIRFTKGIARWTANFTVPTVEYSGNYSGQDSECKLLLHCNGSNGGTTFTDSSAYAKTPATIGGNTNTSTAQTKFGTASVYFDGSGDYLKYTAGDADFNLAAYDWTIDFWLYSTRTEPTNQYSRIVTLADGDVYTTGFQVAYEASGTSLYIGLSTNGSGWQYNPTGMTVTQNTWQHWAFCRNGNSVYAFRNGTLLASTHAFSGSIYYTGTNALQLGGQTVNSRYFQGYIDEFRWIKGRALWTEAFTAPTAEYNVYNGIKITPATGGQIFNLTTATNTKVKADAQYNTMTLIGSSRGWYPQDIYGTWSTTV